MAQNLELKSRCPDLAAALAGLADLELRDGGVQHQVDTYFVVPNGRLKLREIDDERAELIAYTRPDEESARLSDYLVVPVHDGRLLKAALTAALGIRGEVRKRREIRFWHNVRIHLDEVDGLGSFVEFEAVLSETDDLPTAERRLADLAGRMKLRDEDRIGVSYSDLRGL